MAKARAAAGSLLFLIVAPGTVAGLAPWLLTDWRSSDPPSVSAVSGGLLIAAGALVLLHAFARFVLDGIGTPAPIAPTQRLVIAGAYRWVRNPMYLAIGAVIVGEALLLGRPLLLAYLAGFAAAVEAFVRLYEEPTLASRYGDEYEHYRNVVPRWLPRRPQNLL